ncbi:uncharacterized protein LOC120352321 [Nilaparvata lugens]|uniref:uncharacterized protein LOC120352321 n=1 Tax=Nilaparvata lugens TaxID=108931 RepID=UPI00193E64D6|nr:uncharacterized protein LOC120352321 [Nilaparvata lugens]
MLQFYISRVCKSEKSTTEHPDFWSTTVIKILTTAADDSSSWDNLHKESVRAYFDLVMHEVWECKNHEQETVFFRVVNTFITVKKVYLFYYDGVTFKRESLPDGKTVLLHIIEETFYESKDDEISKKYGEKSLYFNLYHKD